MTGTKTFESFEHHIYVPSLNRFAHTLTPADSQPRGCVTFHSELAHGRSESSGWSQLLSIAGAHEPAPRRPATFKRLCLSPIKTVASQLKVPQRLALSQHSHQPPRALRANAIVCQRQTRQRLTPPQDTRQRSSSLSTDIIEAQIEMS
eukprot:491781-Rhodomonas_salina.4